MKTVALVDWHWKGHHPTYFTNLMEGFVKVGCRVAAFCPKSAVEDVRHAASGSNHITVHPTAFSLRMRHLPRFLKEREHAWRTFGKLAKDIRNWERMNSTHVDLVFFATIYDFDFPNFHHTSSYFKIPWSGIYLHARAFRMPGSPMPYFNQLPCPEKIFTHPSLSSVCLIDEGAVAPMMALTSGKPAFEFPDITGTEIEHPLDGDTLSGKLLRFANGRKIVACIGHLQKTKGIIELCKASADPSLQDICFFFGGEMNWNDLTTEEACLIRTTWERRPNIITHLARISDETMNSLIRASNIVFAAYTNFPNSSNVMTKASLLERPLIVSEGHLMAERVRKYKLGAIVPEESVVDIVRQIRHLCDHGGAPDADYQAYYAKHSPEALTDALDKVISTIN